MLLVQTWPFFQLFFLLFNNGKENVFYDILERKIAFLAYKNRNFKKSKNFHFFQVLNPWFWSKNGHFSNFFLCNKGQENVFYDILEHKIAFLGYNNKNFKKLKNWHFSKGVTHTFGQKMAIFPTFFFRQLRLGKCLLRYSRTENRLSRL